MRKVKINTLKGFEKVRDRYYITDEGNVLSIDEKGEKQLSIKLSSPSKKSKGGYRTVCLCTSESTGKQRGYYKDLKRNIYPRICRLVALAFIPNPDNKTQVDHIDENNLNDRVNNLRWNTPKENSRHSNAKRVYCYSDRGLEKIYECGADVAIDGFNKGHALAVARGTENHHKKRVFSFKELNIQEVIQRLSKPSSIREGSRVHSSEWKQKGD